jgi:hypothetical protein
MLQLIVKMCFCLIDLCVKDYLDPYESRVGGFMEKFNDTLFLVSSYFTLLFTNLTVNQED